MPQYKTDFVYQKEHQDSIPVKQRVSPEDVKAPSLLAPNKAREALKNLDGWQLTDDHKMLYREFILRDFMSVVGFIDRIAIIAEDEKHHPDLHLTQYRNLRVGLTSHDLGGLSEKDLIVARKINEDQQSPNKERPVQKPRFEKKKNENKGEIKKKEVKIKKSVNRVRHAVKKA